MTSTLLTYKNSLGQVVQETYAWKKATEDQQESFGLVHSAIIKNYESIDNFNTKIKSLRSEAEGFIQSFRNNGKLDSTFISDLKNQLDELGRGENLKKAKQELADFVSYLKRLKTSENQIITLQKSMDKLAEIKGKLTDGKKIELMSDNQASAVQQVEVQMQKMQEAMTQLQGGATKTSTEIRTLTTESQNAGNKLKMAFDEGTASVNKLGSSLKTISSYILGGGVLIQGIQAIKNAFSELTDIDRELINITRVSDITQESFGSITANANQMARELGTATSGVINLEYEVNKLGNYTQQQAEAITRNISLYSAVGDLDLESAMNNIVSTMKAFNIQAEDTVQIVDKLDQVGNRFAVDSAQIGEGLRVSSASMATAGNSLSQTIAMITAGTEITRDANEMGQALKTINITCGL